VKCCGILLALFSCFLLTGCSWWDVSSPPPPRTVIQMHRAPGFSPQTGLSDADPGTVVTARPIDTSTGVMHGAGSSGAEPETTIAGGEPQPGLWPPPVTGPEPAFPCTQPEDPATMAESPGLAPAGKTGSGNLVGSAPVLAPSPAPIPPGGLAPGIAGTGTGGFAHGPGQSTVPPGIPSNQPLPLNATPALPPLNTTGSVGAQSGLGNSSMPGASGGTGTRLGETNISGSLSSGNPVLAPGTGLGSALVSLTNKATMPTKTLPDSGFLAPRP